MYVAKKLLPMARNNIMASRRLVGLEKCRVSHGNTFCKIFNNLHDLMALNGHSGATDCTQIPSNSKMDPTMVFFMV